MAGAGRSSYSMFSFASSWDYVLMLLGTIGAIVHGLALPAFILVFGKLLNSFGSLADSDPHEMYRQICKNALYLVYLALILLITSWAEVACWIQTGERQVAKLRLKYLEAILRQDVSYFDVQARSGDMVSAIGSDTAIIQEAICEKVGNCTHFFFTFVGGFFVGFATVPLQGAVTLVVIPLIIAVGGVYTFILTGLSSKAIEAYATAGSVAEEALAQIRTIYSYVREEKAQASYSNALVPAMQVGYKSALVKGLGVGGMYATFSSWALLLWFGGWLVRRGKAAGGSILATILAVLVGGLSLGQASAHFAVFAKAASAASKIMSTINHVPEINKEDGIQLPSVEGHLELRDVHFSYPARPEVEVLKGLSLCIPPGQSFAIVGTSGSGKSTVVSLIERFYDPPSGAVLLDGHNVRSLHLKWLRSQIGLVNQEPLLFATSIRENILFGKPEASEQETVQAATASNAHSFISQLPNGYDTQVGERGVQLSGGQKQRVAIARAIIKNPAVLLFDEATSALDAQSEQVVQEALAKLMVGHTTVVVAHRLSTIRNCDQIAVMDKGKLVEIGTHSELINNQSGPYASLVRLQEMANDTGADDRGRTSSPMCMHDSGDSLHFPVMILPEKSAPQETPINGYFWRAVKLSFPESSYLVMGGVGAILAGLVNPTFAFLVIQVLQIYFSPDTSYIKSQVTTYSIVFACLGLVLLGIFFMQHYCFGVCGERLTKRIREMMFSAIMSFEVAWFDREDNTSSQVASRLTSTSNLVKAGVGDLISTVLQNSTLLFTGLVVAFILQWRVAFVITATLPLIVAAGLAEQMFLKGFAGNVAKTHERATKVAVEGVSNIRTVAAFNGETKLVDLVERELQEPMKSTKLRGHISGVLYGLGSFFLYTSYGLALWYGGLVVKQGHANFGEVLKAYFVLVMTSYGVAETIGLSPNMLRGVQALKEVFKILDRKPGMEDGHTQVEHIQGLVEFRNVTFAYPSRPQVTIFKDLNLRVDAGGSLALVGASGSGKSSILALIERFYDPDDGVVLVDGQDIRSFKVRTYRQHVALVEQEPGLFAGSIYDNISCGSKDGSYTEEEVMAAAQVAGVHTFVRTLPLGYKTTVGERGVQLSGGQKQRVAIARAVMKKPAILLLDEATSALDLESEKAVQEALNWLMKDSTTIVIAHRLSTVWNADQIAVVEDGKIIEQGSHRELVSRPHGAYSKLVSLQQQQT